jgi:hypothetical protein
MYWRGLYFFLRIPIPRNEATAAQSMIWLTRSVVYHGRGMLSVRFGKVESIASMRRAGLGPSGIPVSNFNFFLNRFRQETCFEASMNPIIRPSRDHRRRTTMGTKTTSTRVPRRVGCREHIWLSTRETFRVGSTPAIHLGSTEVASQRVRGRLFSVCRLHTLFARAAACSRKS